MSEGVCVSVCDVSLGIGVHATATYSMFKFCSCSPRNKQADIRGSRPSLAAVATLFICQITAYVANASDSDIRLK